MLSRTEFHDRAPSGGEDPIQLGTQPGLTLSVDLHKRVTRSMERCIAAMQYSDI